MSSLSSEKISDSDKNGVGKEGGREAERSPNLGEKFASALSRTAANTTINIHAPHNNNNNNNNNTSNSNNNNNSVRGDKDNDKSDNTSKSNAGDNIIRGVINGTGNPKRKEGEETNEIETEMRHLASMITRQASRGYTGETWYDFDLPLDRSDPITILHFNDVYNVDSRPDGSGGVARFVTAMQRYSHLHPLIFFSGDAFNPSIMSTYTRGRHMIPFLNLLKVHTACFGNHDFDFGVDELEYAVGSCTFPWLISNVFEKTGSKEEEILYKKMDEVANAEAAATAAAQANSGDVAGVTGTGGGEGRKNAGRSSPPSTDTGISRLGYDSDNNITNNDSDLSSASTSTFSWFWDDEYAGLPGQPVANGGKYRLFEWQGIRIGIIGLVEKEWLDTLACVDKDDVTYVDYVFAANRLSRFLRSKECELIIALTHMRSGNDQRLAEEAEDIDIILGGHDHDYYGVQVFGDIPVCKSGTDFYDFTVLTIHPGKCPTDRTGLLKPGSGVCTPQNIEVGKKGKTNIKNNNVPKRRLLPSDIPSGNCVLSRFMGGSSVEWQRVRVDKSIEKNKHVELLVKKYESHLKTQMNKILVDAGCELETRFKYLRTRETNVGSWLCDLLRKECRADIAILNSGTIRSDCVFPVAPFRYGDLSSMLPMADEVCVIECTGKCIYTALENSVSQVPKTEGRFLQVSGVRFCFDSSKPKGERVIRDSIRVRRWRDGTVSDVHTPVNEYCNNNNNNSKNRGGNKYNNDAMFTNWDEYSPLIDDEIYLVATKLYVAQGRDGYDMFPSCPIIEQELYPCLPSIVRQTLSMTALANGYKRPHSRIVMKHLNTFTSMTNEMMVKDFGCCVSDEKKFVLAPVMDGRIKDVNPDPVIL